MTQDDHLHVVVQAGGRHAAQVLKGADVLADRGREVLALHEVEIQAAGVAQDVAEQVDAPPAFLSEVEVIGAVVHLRLGSRGCLKADHGLRRRLRSQASDPLADHRVAAAKAPGLQLFVDTDGGHVRVAFQELADEPFVFIEGTRPPSARRQVRWGR